MTKTVAQIYKSADTGRTKANNLILSFQYKMRAQTVAVILATLD